MKATFGSLKGASKSVGEINPQERREIRTGSDRATDTLSIGLKLKKGEIEAF